MRRNRNSLNHDLKDKYLKDMTERHLEEVIGLLHPEGRYEIISTQLDKESIKTC